MIRSLLFVLGLVLLPAAARAAPPKDWSRTVTVTPEGAYAIGNPAAKTRLVEYVSYTCPHCAHFVAEATGPLKSGWVSRGALVTEVRNLVRDRYDLAAALLALCGGQARFPGNHEAIFAAFPQWIEKVQAYETAPSTLPADANLDAALIDVADKTGLFALMSKRGITPAQGRACLIDAKAREAVMAMRKRALEQDGITGTPGFLIDGKRVDAHDWAALRPLLPAPGK